MTDTETHSGAMPHQIPEDLADVNADLGRRVVVDTALMAWEQSPSGTVWRKPLYRSRGEYGPVTSLVRYARGGAFPGHAHPEKEDILVLDGVFSDEHGDYPAGTFLMNPHGSRHAPRSQTGCTLFVRLRRIGRAWSRTPGTRPAGGRVWWRGSACAPSMPRPAIPRTWRWCAGPRGPTSSGTPTGAARRSWCWRASSPMSMPGTPKDLDPKPTSERAHPLLRDRLPDLCSGGRPLIHRGPVQPGLAAERLTPPR